MSNDTILDLDALLDSTMDGVKDVPDFVNPPAGVYMLRVKEAKSEQYTQKAKDGKPEQKALRLKIMYEVAETIETKEAPVADGSLFSESFMATEDGLGYFKNQAKKIFNVKELGDAKIRDILESLTGQEFKAAITIRKTGEYENVQVRPVHEVAAS